MDILKDFIYVNKTAGINGLKGLKRNWIIIFTGIVYSILNLVIFNIVGRALTGPLSLLFGFIAVIISSSFISNYLYLLSNIVNYNRVSLQDFKDGFGHYLGKIYGVFFIGYIINLLLSFITPILGNLVEVLNIIIYFGVLVLLNPLPETIYLKHYRPWESILYTIEFVQENWLNWLIPNVILVFLLYLITGNIVTDLFSTHLSFNYVFDPYNITLYLIGQLVFSFMMIFRGNLYKILSTSTRRKRKFMNKF